jgi:hypothetical protein
MKKITTPLCVITLLLVTSFTANAQEDSATMKKWMEFMMPGKFHEMLAKDNGQWDEEITLWMAPGAPPTTSTATAENKMIMGGRYQHSMHRGTFAGMPFEGMSIVGYDNLRKVFVSSWVDNMGTGIMYMEGKWDPASRSIHFEGKMSDPMAGKEVPVREVFKIVDDNNQLLTMYNTVNGKELKAMEIKFKRK